jgi:hypothetical protein
MGIRTRRVRGDRERLFGTGSLLRTDPRDVGCQQAMELLHVYVDLAVADPGAAAERYPGIAAHQRACGPSSQDFEGLLAAVTGPAAERRLAVRLR